MNREQLLNEIQALEFYIQELNLYLDTHSGDEEVIALYNQALARYYELVTQFENRYGPLSTRATNNSRQYQWIRDPWPWQRSGNPPPPSRENMNPPPSQNRGGSNNNPPPRPRNMPQAPTDNNEQSNNSNSGGQS